MGTDEEVWRECEVMGKVGRGLPARQEGGAGSKLRVSMLIKLI